MNSPTKHFLKKVVGNGPQKNTILSFLTIVKKGI